MNGGNPNHAKDGKFTSGPNQAGNGGNNVETKKTYEDQIKEKMGITNDANPSYEEKMQSTFGIRNPQPAEPENKKWTISTSEGKEVVEADTEEEAMEIAKDKYPGYADELTVNPVEENNGGNNLISNANDELNKNGATVVGEKGNSVVEVTTDGQKYYAKTYETDFNGPIEGTESDIEFDDADGFNSLEEVLNALNKDGYPVYDGLKTKPVEQKVKEMADEFYGIGSKEKQSIEKDLGERDAHKKKIEYNAQTLKSLIESKENGWESKVDEIMNNLNNEEFSEVYKRFIALTKGEK